MDRSRWRRWMRGVVLAMGGTTLFSGCNTELAREFRSVAGQGIQQGVTAIATSVIDGIFAVISPDNTTSS